jgi:hypothetical protein
MSKLCSHGFESLDLRLDNFDWACAALFTLATAPFAGPCYLAVKFIPDTIIQSLIGPP